jgi:hypothetical protein
VCSLFVPIFWQVILMSHRYEFSRAAGENGLMLIFTEGTFENLPFEVRLAARWTGLGYGSIAELKTADRRALLAVGYAIVREAVQESVVPAAARRQVDVPENIGLRQAA